MFSYQPEMLRYEVVNTLPKLKRLHKKMRGLKEFAFDTETNTLKVLGDNDNFKIVGISISWGEYNNYYIPLGHVRLEDVDRQLSEGEVAFYLKPIFERTDIRIVGHNLKFDMHVMSRIGINIRTKDLFDTMIASWLCDENTPNGLKENSQMWLGINQTHFADVVDDIPKEIKKEFGLKANSKATFDLALIDDAAPYALADSFYTWELYLGFMLKLEEEKMDKVYYKVYIPFLHTLYTMEEHGVTVDVDRLKEMEKDITEDIQKLEYEMIELAGVQFNPASSQQLCELLFGYDKSKNVNENILKYSFDFPVQSTTAKGAPQVNADVLWNLSKQSYKTKRKQEGVKFCTLLLEYKKLGKLKSAFIEGLLEQLYDDGKAHPSFNIIGTDSGRISCSNPNLQQLPKADEEDKYKIRSLFIGSKCLVDEDGEFLTDDVNDKEIQGTISRKKIVALDFANLEMRVLAHFSQDKNLLNMFNSGADTHGDTAVNMFELDCTPDEVKKKYPHLRQAAKILNFLLMYGGGAKSLYDSLRSDHYNPIDLGDKSYLDTYKVKKGVEVAQIYIDKYFSTYSGVAKFIKDQKRFAHKHGYVYTLLKRKRRLPDINSSDMGMVSYCERLSVNSAIQGSAADITMTSQNRVSADPWFEEHGVYMILQVHDELVFECPELYVDECIERVKWLMEHSFGDDVQLNLPMRADADSGDSYQEAK